MVSLQELRAGRGMSVADLASRSAVSRAAIVAIEAGQNPPQLRTIRKLCAALRVEPSDVAEFAERLGDRPATSMWERRSGGA